MTASAFTHAAEPWAEADLDALPRDGNRYEIIEGRLIVIPHASDFHGTTQGHLGALLLSARPEGFGSSLSVESAYRAATSSQISLS